MEYEAVIGLEVHVQLKTRSKAFSRSAQGYGEHPNRLTDPVVLGLPGALPVLNQEAIRQTIRAGLIFKCQIANVCRWDRKNYFYPDSPKNYQITQQDQPICCGGLVEIELAGPSRNVMGIHREVKLNRIHLEEDVGKLTHSGEISLVDFNRAGTPLAEIVSEPDMYSPEEAFAYLTSLKMHLQCAGVSDCDMEKGQMRCDANVSLRPVGSKKLGTRVELKNLNSISGVRNGIDYEIRRQTGMLNRGETIHQETRRWDATRNVSEPMRQKESANDYCYFPEPDLMPVKISREQLQEIQDLLPERPFDRQRRFFSQYQLPYTITSVLCPNTLLSDFFEAVVELHHNPRSVANLIVNDLLREVSQHGQANDDLRLSPADLAQLVKLVDDGEISKQAAQNVLIEMYRSRDCVKNVIKTLGLCDSKSSCDLIEICRQVIDENPKPVQQYRAGKVNAINALKGQVMAQTKGRANPQQLDEMLRQLLDG